MRVTRLELSNFRMFSHLVIENPPDMIVLVSPNGLGKSTILEAIAGTHELVSPYHQEHYPFRQAWQERSASYWPEHLPPPVRAGETRAEIKMEIEANERECTALVEHGIHERVGQVRFVIEDGRYVTEEEADEVVKWLFRYHTPSLGVGFFDYIKPVRFYRHRALGDFTQAFSDDRTKQVFMEFHRQSHEDDKFATFKSFVAGLQLDDFSRHAETGEELDSLRDLRRVFDMFFAPKRFLGYRRPANGEPQMAVATPFGEHDVDFLSDGEKEILHIIGHLFRFRDLENVVLWDTPELHLNAALECRLFDALQQIAPSNQYWIATHSLEFINSVPLENLFVLRNQAGEAVLEEARGPESKARIAIYRELGAQVGLQLVSSRVVFVEGKEARSDKRILDRLVSREMPNVNFVAGGDCETILALGTRTNQLLEEATTNADFLAVVDRDYRSDDELAELEKQYQGRVFVWHVHEIENLFLDAEIIYPTLQFHDQLGAFPSEEDVSVALDQAASELREWIAGDWAAWRLHHAYRRPPRRISGEDPFESLQTYAQALRADLGELADPNHLQQLYDEALAEVDEIVSRQRSHIRLPGKQVLRHLLSEHTTLSPEAFIPTAVSLIMDQGIELPEIGRLEQRLQD